MPLFCSRPVSSLDEDDEDTDEEMKDRSRRRSTEGASDWGTMKKRLSTLRQVRLSHVMW